MEVLKQDRSSPLDVALQVSILYAVVHNMLMDVPVERISAFENALFDHLTVQHPEILEDIRKTGRASAGKRGRAARRHRILPRAVHGLRSAAYGFHEGYQDAHPQRREHPADHPRQWSSSPRPSCVMRANGSSAPAPSTRCWVKPSRAFRPGLKETPSVYSEVRPVKKTCFVVIGGDRGLAGGYNANLHRLVLSLAGSEPYCVLPIGKKPLEQFTRSGAELVSTYFGLAASVGIGDCMQIARLLCDGFAPGAMTA